MFKTAQFRELVFSGMYVMTEGSAQSASSAEWKWSMLLLLIDMFQVLRGIGAPGYGWNEDSVFTVRRFDLVWLFASQIRRVVHYAAFYLLAVTLVLVALADCAYVVKLLRGGHVTIIWPLKVLRFLVATIVTSFFSTALEWLLYPVDCHADDTSMSELLRGQESALCTPWSSPEIAVTVPTILLALAYIVFSLLTTLLSFEVNPLSQHPRAACTGRVEVLWVAFKVAAIVLAFLANHVSKTVVVVLLLLLALGLLFQHLRVMPFNCHFTNMWRAGVYAAVAWFSLASVVVSTQLGQQPLVQWALLAALPVSFVGGVYLAHERRSRILGFLSMLRKEWEVAQAEEARLNDKLGRRPSFTTSATGRPASVAGLPEKRSTYDKFFEKRWEQRGNFLSAVQAHTAARQLLGERAEEDLPFLAFTVQRGLEEHPDHQDLLVFQLMALRFILRDVSQAAAQQKLVKMSNKALDLDRAYTLYAVSRRATQEFAGASLGKGTISAVNLIEFDSKMEAARQSHQNCTTALKKLWRAGMVLKRPQRARHDESCKVAKVQDVEQETKEMMTYLRDLEESVEKAKQEYHWLLDKYPGSASLLTSYAHFSDTVLNDHLGAEAMLHQAAMVEDCEEDEGELAGDVAASAEKGAGKEEICFGDGRSTATSESESARVRISKYIQTWAHLILGTEEQAVNRFNRRIRASTILLVMLSAVGFVLVDLILFNDIALNNIQHIDHTGLFRSYAISSMFVLRSQHLAAWAGDEEAWGAAEHDNEQYTNYIKEEHIMNYQRAQGGALKEFFDSAKLRVNLPRGGQWAEQQQTFWELGNDYVRRVHFAGHCTMEEYVAEDYGIGSVSEEKRNVAYTFENTVRSVLPAMEEQVSLYELQVREFERLAWICLSLNLGLNGFLVLLMSALVLGALKTIVQNIQHKYVASYLLRRIPRHTCKKMYRYYQAIEEALITMGDEDAERKALEATVEATGSSFDSPIAMRGLGSLGRRNSFEGAFPACKTGMGFNSFAALNSPTRAASCSSQFSVTRALNPPPCLSREDEDPFRPLRTTSGQSFTSLPSDPGHDADSSLPEPLSLPLTADNLERLRSLSSKPPSDQALAFAPRPSDPRHIPLSQRLAHASESSGSSALLEEPALASEQAAAAGVFVPSSRSSQQQQRRAIARWDSLAACALRDARRRPASAPPDQPAALLLNSPAASDSHSSSPPDNAAGALEGPQDQPASSRRSSSGCDDPGRSSSSGCDDPGRVGASHACDRARTPPPRRPASSDAEADDADSASASGIALLEEPEQGARDRRGEAGGGGKIPRLPLCELPSSQAALLRGKSALKPSRAVSMPEPREIVAERQPGEPKIRFSEARTLLRISANGSFSREESLQKFSDSLKKLETALLAPVETAEKSRTPAEEDHDDDDEGSKPPQSSETLCSVSADELASTKRAVQQQQSTYFRVPLYAAVMALVLALCLFSVAFPSRHIATLVDVGPTSNQGSRRMALMRACVHLTRELVLQDGLSRMSKEEVAGTLSFLVSELKEADDAIRLGGAKGIRVGADHRDQLHNRIMYDNGCPWRYPETLGITVDKVRRRFHGSRREEKAVGEANMEECEHPVIGQASETGLFALLLQFFDAVETVLNDYAPPRDTWINVYDSHEHLVDVRAFDRVETDPERISILESDINVAFIMSEFDGDLFSGFNAVVHVFEHEMKEIIDTVHSENRILIALYITLVGVFFYLFLFRKTMRGVHAELGMARAFVFMMPLHILSKCEIELVKQHFCTSDGSSDHFDEANHDAPP